MYEQLVEGGKTQTINIATSEQDWKWEPYNSTDRAPCRPFTGLDVKYTKGSGEAAVRPSLKAVKCTWLMAASGGNPI